MGYFKHTVIGVSWMSAFRISSRIITILRIVILARLLTPAQFGVFGIATFILALLEILTETGINVFLIQEKDNIDEYVNDAWLVSIVRGVFLSVLLIALSPLIVLFFNAPSSSRLLFLISFVPFIRGFINPSIVKYQKDLLFNKEFFLRFSVFAFDSIAVIALAFFTHDEISFIWGLIAGALLEVILSFLLIKPHPQIVSKIENLRKIIHRGKWVTLYGIFHYLAQEGDTMVVGKLLGTQSLGIYQMAYKFSTLPISEITDVVNKVVFPVYARIADDRVRLMRAFRRSMIVISIAVVSLSLMILFLPREFFIFILGQQWSKVADIIKILAIYGMLRSIASASSTLLLSVKRQDYIARITFMRFITLATTIVPLTFKFGLGGTAFSALLSVFVELPFLVYYIYKIVNSNHFTHE